MNKQTLFIALSVIVIVLGIVFIQDYSRAKSQNVEYQIDASMRANEEREAQRKKDCETILSALTENKARLEVALDALQNAKNFNLFRSHKKKVQDIEGASRVVTELEDAIAQQSQQAIEYGCK